MKICNCFLDLQALFCDIPSKWRKGIVDAFCYVLSNSTADCEELKKCETLTYLSPFSLVGTELAISFKNEKGVTKTSFLDIAPLFDVILNDIDPKCLMSQSEWEALTLYEKIQAVINAKCDCCETTTTSTSTTTTTTEHPCPVCETWEVENTSGDTIAFFYDDCDTYEQVYFEVPNNVTTQFCTCANWTPPVFFEGVLLSNLGVGCFATTTTTTSSTTTTTTVAPTTTTTSSSTTTTTAPTTTTTSSTTTTTTATPTTTTTSSSTTTTTTEAAITCIQYLVQGTPDIYVEWEDCGSGSLLSTSITSGSAQNICARVGSMNQTGGSGTITPGADCSEDLTSTTTTSSTTTTTTEEPTTTTTTSSSTTTTTTAEPTTTTTTSSTTTTTTEETTTTTTTTSSSTTTTTTCCPITDITGDGGTPTTTTTTTSP